MRLSRPGERPSLLALLAISLIRGYQIFISPLLGANCRFYPSCSQYALAVFREWGFLRGAWLTVGRLLRCGPWHDGGYDPPPLRPRGARDDEAGARGPR
ncbi:MAG: membrane protein insertion efficiency factor YidD [Synergistaceae bacterium]|nr:membrane protein insertion efficiency factor YidD [Synergistaceae bacterium]